MAQLRCSQGHLFGSQYVKQGACPTCGSTDIDKEEYISVYTRAQAIADGQLVEVNDAARDCGFKLPAAVTAAVWAELNEKMGTGETIEGRLHDLFFVAWINATKNPNRFILHFKVKVGRKRQEYKMVGHKGDHGEWVITVMKPEED